MNFNSKRLIFILFSISLSWADIISDIIYTRKIEDPTTYDALVAFIVIQPLSYLFYFWLYLIVSQIFGDLDLGLLNFIFSFIFRAPIYMIIAEFKLMLTFLHKITLCKETEVFGDRIKQDFITFLIIQSIFESLPMAILQILTNFDLGLWDSVSIVSPAISLCMVFHGFFCLDVVRRMNLGGLEWIQLNKKKLHFFSMAHVRTATGDSSASLAIN
ncbi:unnamed protein product [Blepharisma stoltei]|uniref:Uncharacterized protein n=1 Tax=Blepharisma stoltei TaxID=1481888 RepID=A0AAU9JXX6_9CILI|nr:unnamed protein product [Blepharisma stoltei]